MYRSLSLCFHGNWPKERVTVVEGIGSEFHFVYKPSRRLKLLFTENLGKTCVGQGCETSTFRACNCVGMISADGSKKSLPDSLDDAIIESNIRLVSNI